MIYLHYPGLPTTSRNNPIISDLSKTPTFPESNAEDLVPRLPGVNRVPEQYGNKSEAQNQNSMQESLLADSSLFSNSRTSVGESFSEALSLSSLVLKSSKTPPPSPISPSPPFSHTSASTEGEARSETLDSAPQGCILYRIYAPCAPLVCCSHPRVPGLPVSPLT